MGDPDANEYDEDKIFTHLVFYIDTPANARENDLKSSRPSKAATLRYVYLVASLCLY